MRSAAVQLVISSTVVMPLQALSMPLKYLFGLPLAVRVVGTAHGVLFVLYALLVFEAVGAGRFNLRTAALAMLASVLPFGPFVFERRRADVER